MKTYKQGTLVWPKEPIQFGRVKAHCGQSFWVTTSELSQKEKQTVGLARSGRSSGHAHLFTLADAERFFTTSQ